MRRSRPTDRAGLRSGPVSDSDSGGASPDDQHGQVVADDDTTNLLQVVGATTRLAGRRLRKGRSFSLVLLLLTITFGFGVAAPDQPWADGVFLLLISTTAVSTLRVGRVRGHLVRVVLLTALAGALAAITGSVANVEGMMPVAGLLVCGLMPFAILAGISRKDRIDIETVSAALSAYLLLGFTFSFLFTLVDAVHPPFFAQDVDASRSDFLYFSFVTLTTVGYGDLSAQSSVGRSMAVLEAVLGQLYLVSAVAIVVGNLGARRQARRSGTSGPIDA